jgi:hypothetical protein
MNGASPAERARAMANGQGSSVRLCDGNRSARRDSRGGGYGSRLPATVPTALLIAATHACVSFGFFPFAAFTANFAASWSRCLALWRTCRLFFGDAPLAPSIRLVARSSFFMRGGGTI